MPPQLQFDMLKLIANIGMMAGALLSLWKIFDLIRNFIVNKVVRPIENINCEIHSMKEEKKAELAVAEHFYRKRLQGDYDYYMSRGEISTKQKLDFMLDIETYRKLNFNHISDTMEEDIESLPIIGQSR